jgi:hypothetical protein
MVWGVCGCAEVVAIGVGAAVGAVLFSVEASFFAVAGFDAGVVAASTDAGAGASCVFAPDCIGVGSVGALGAAVGAVLAVAACCCGSACCVGAVVSAINCTKTGDVV